MAVFHIIFHQVKKLFLQRVASANRTEALRHRENFCDVKAERELILEQKRREIEEKDERSKQHYFEYLKHREKHIQENRYLIILNLQVIIIISSLHWCSKLRITILLKSHHCMRT